MTSSVNEHSIREVHAGGADAGLAGVIDGAVDQRPSTSGPVQRVGDITSGDVVALSRSLTVGEAIDELRARDDAEAGRTFYIYVVDEGGRLVGVVSMRDLVLARPTMRLSRVMSTAVVAVRADADPGEVARLLTRHRYLALPVVDGGRRLIGVVSAADVMRVLEEDATDEVQRMFGAGTDERLTSPWHFSVRKRLPWLLVSLVLATVAASVIRVFEGTIGAWTVLAMYMPIVAGMGGNASAQAMAVAVRGIAVGQADRVTVRQVVARELRVGAASGLVTGLVAAAVATTLHADHAPLLGGLVAVSLLINHTIACAWGAAVPFVMKGLGFDPAQSATIFATTLTDMVGFFTLLGLATASLQLAG